MPKKGLSQNRKKLLVIENCESPCTQAADFSLSYEKQAELQLMRTTVFHVKGLEVMTIPQFLHTLHRGRKREKILILEIKWEYERRDTYSIFRYKSVEL